MYTKRMSSITFSYGHDYQKSGKKSDFSKKFNFLWTQLDGIVFLVFHPHDPKPKRIHQIASNRAKTRSTQIQTCVKYRGIIIFISRNKDVNSGGLKIRQQKMSKLGVFSRRYL